MQIFPTFFKGLIKASMSRHVETTMLVQWFTSKGSPQTVLHDATIYAGRAVLHSAQVGGVETEHRCYVASSKLSTKAEIEQIHIYIFTI